MIIGDAILSQFFAEFSYNGNGDGWNNTMTLTATPYSLPETYVGNVLYDTHITLPKNETEPYDPEAAGVETSAGSKFSTLEKVEIWGAGALGLLVAIIIILFIVISCQGGSVTNQNAHGVNDMADDMVYQTDRNTLMKEARDKVYY